MLTEPQNDAGEEGQGLEREEWRGVWELWLGTDCGQHDPFVTLLNSNPPSGLAVICRSPLSAPAEPQPGFGAPHTFSFLLSCTIR